MLDMMKKARNFMHCRGGRCYDCAKPHVRRSWLPESLKAETCVGCGGMVLFLNLPHHMYIDMMEDPQVVLLQQY